MPGKDPNVDFYSTPNPVEEEVPSAGVELPLAQSRAVTRNHVGAYTLLIIMVISAVVLLVLQEEPVERIVDKVAERKRQVAQAEGGSEAAGASEEELSREIRLYDGPYVLDFMPATEKENGLSLFYIFSTKEDPQTSYFRVQREVLMQNIGEEASVAPEGSLGTSSTEIEGKAITNQVDDVVLTRVDIYLKVANRHLENREYTKAQKTLEKLLELDAAHRKAQRLLLDVYIQEKAFAKAIELYTELDKGGELDVHELNDFGVVLASARAFDRAQVVLERAYQLSGGGVEPALNLGLNYLVTGKYAPAIDILEKLLATKPDHPAALSHLAYAHIGAVQHESARAVAKRLIAVAPDSPEGALILAESFAMEHDVTQALLWLKSAKQKMDPLKFRQALQRHAFSTMSENGELASLLL